MSILQIVSRNDDERRQIIEMMVGAIVNNHFQLDERGAYDRDDARVCAAAALDAADRTRTILQSGDRITKYA